MIRTFLFDLGNVLVHFSAEQMWRQIGAVCNCPDERVRELLFESGLLAELERGRISEQDAYRRFTDSLDTDADLDRLRLAVCDIFSLNAPMMPVLDALKSQGHRLILFSNTSLAHFRWIEQQFDVLQRFDDCITSYEVGAAKPEPAMFETALERIQCIPADCFYADDIQENIDAGRRHGLQAELYRDTETLLRQLEQHGIQATGVSNLD